MPLYDYRCPQGHAFEQMATIDGRQQQPCPACGQAAAKIPSRVSLGGQASPGASLEQMPQTWRGTYEGHPEYVGQLRRQWETRRRLEDKYEELRGDRRPVLAHEGQLPRRTAARRRPGARRGPAWHRRAARTGARPAWAAGARPRAARAQPRWRGRRDSARAGEGAADYAVMPCQIGKRDRLVPPGQRRP